jgi:transcriptional regulator with XRE-family HTH domain
MTLADVAERCVPPTTAQTIGRLETGTRTVSVGWLNRIAGALGVTAAELVTLPERADLPIIALLGRDGVNAPAKPMLLATPQAEAGIMVIRVEEGIGDYRAGDVIWCERIEPDQMGRALNRDVIVPRPAGRFAFGRMIGGEDMRLLLLPLMSGARQTVINDPPWIGVARRMVREL